MSLQQVTVSRYLCFEYFLVYIQIIIDNIHFMCILTKIRPLDDTERNSYYISACLRIRWFPIVA